MTNRTADGGEAIVQALRDLNIDYVFSSPGSEWGAVWEAMARQKIGRVAGPTYLNCGHEMLAVDLAIGYTTITGRMQATLLHAGSGLMQGAMGVYGARTLEIPMILMSGEALTYGADENFDPGMQWYAYLSVVGGPQTLMEHLVKWATQVPSSAVLYEMVIRAGEMAQRLPKGPTYLNVPIETMLQPWAPPENFRRVPPRHASRPTQRTFRGLPICLFRRRPRSSRPNPEDANDEDTRRSSNLRTSLRSLWLKAQSPRSPTSRGRATCIRDSTCSRCSRTWIWF